MAYPKTVDLNDIGLDIDMLQGEAAWSRDWLYSVFSWADDRRACVRASGALKANSNTSLYKAAVSEMAKVRKEERTARKEFDLQLTSILAKLGQIPDGYHPVFFHQHTFRGISHAVGFVRSK